MEVIDKYKTVEAMQLFSCGLEEGVPCPGRTRGRRGGPERKGRSMTRKRVGGQEGKGLQWIFLNLTVGR